MRLVCLLTVLALSGCGESSGDTSSQPNENQLGVLVECDQVIEEVIGWVPPNPEDVFVRRHKVAVIPVTDPASVAVTRCDQYFSLNGEAREEFSSVDDTNCRTSGSWVYDVGVTFTPNFEVYVECEEEEVHPDGTSQASGSERVYFRESPKDTPRAEGPLGHAVECDQVIEEVERRTFGEGDAAEVLEKVTRWKVARIPVADPTSVTVTRCGRYYAVDGTITKSRVDCVASTYVESTPDSAVVVECAEDHIYPVGWSYFNDGQGGVSTFGYEHVYLRDDSNDTTPVLESPFGALVECDEVLEWESSPGTVHETRHRLSVTYLPVADPSSVTITRCDGYGTGMFESRSSDTCVSTKGASFTDDFEVYVMCEHERSGWLNDTRGHERIYYQVD